MPDVSEASAVVAAGPAAAPLVLSANGVDPVNLAVEFTFIVPPSGNLRVCQQQFWLGTERAGQRIDVGMTHAGRTLSVGSVDHTFRVYDEDELITEAVRTTGKPIARFKVRKPEPPRHPARPHPNDTDAR